MGRKMWSPGVALPVFLLLLSASVNSGSVINGDGLLFREPDSDLWFGSAPAPSRAPAPVPTPAHDALRDHRYLRQFAEPSPTDLEEMEPYHCPKSGFFAKEGSCKEYYKCEEKSEPGILTAYLFNCSLGMVFDDNLGTCNLASQVTTRPECKTEGTISNETNSISLLTDVSWQIKKFQCNSLAVTEMAEGTDKICTNVNYVEDYVSLVMSMIPLSEYHKNNEKIADIIEHYDRDLEAAQDHAKAWRVGDSIVIGIGQTIKLAKDFEPEFTRKYETNKKRVKTIEDNLHEERSIKQTRDAIVILEERIVNITKTINALPEEYRGSIQHVKTSLEQELVEKRRGLKEDFVLTREIDELIVFLEFVRNDASKIQKVANETRRRIQNFKTNLDTDKTAFLRHLNVSKLALETHNNETIKKNMELAKLAADKVKYENDIKEQKETVKKLRKSITDILDKTAKLRREILSKGPSTKKIFGYIFSFIPFIGLPLLASADADQQAELMKYDSEADLANKRIEAMNSQIENERADAERLQDRIIRESGYSKEIQSQLHDYTILNHDLERMQSQLNELLPALDKAIHGIEGIECMFNSVIGKLDTMIQHAKEAKTDYEKKNVKFYTYNEISVLQDSWKGAHDLLLNLDKCPGILI